MVTVYFLLGSKAVANTTFWSTDIVDTTLTEHEKGSDWSFYVYASVYTWGDDLPKYDFEHFFCHGFLRFYISRMDLYDIQLFLYVNPDKFQFITNELYKCEHFSHSLPIKVVNSGQIALNRSQVRKGTNNKTLHILMDPDDIPPSDYFECVMRQMDYHDLTKHAYISLDNGSFLYPDDGSYYLFPFNEPKHSSISQTLYNPPNSDYFIHPFDTYHENFGKKMKEDTIDFDEYHPQCNRFIYVKRKCSFTRQRGKVHAKRMGDKIDIEEINREYDTTINYDFDKKFTCK